MFYFAKVHLKRKIFLGEERNPDNGAKNTLVKRKDGTSSTYIWVKTFRTRRGFNLFISKHKIFTVTESKYKGIDFTLVIEDEDDKWLRIAEYFEF